MSEAGAGRHQRRRASRERALEIVIVVLLGVTSVATAYASFQSAVYAGTKNTGLAQAQDARTQAESSEVEASMQVAEDADTWQEIEVCEDELASDDPGVAAAAATRYQALMSSRVDGVFAAAIDWAKARDAGGADEDADPTTSPDYVAARFADAHDAESRSADLSQQAEADGDYSDRLNLAVVILAVTLFLLGVSAVVRAIRMKTTLLIIGAVVFTVGIVLAALVPFVAIG